MISFLSKIFGGSKSDKDVKKLQPMVAEINKHYAELQSLTNDQLRNKTQEFRAIIKEHLNRPGGFKRQLHGRLKTAPLLRTIGKINEPNRIVRFI